MSSKNMTYNFYYFTFFIMKKTIVWGLAVAMLLTWTSYVNADEAEVLTDAPELYNITTDVTTTSIEIQSDLISGLLTKYDVILRNNIITVDYDYNSKNYYTKKLDTSNVIIPDEVKEKAKSIYFLLEEQRNWGIMYNDSMAKWEAILTENVKTEYNYKKVTVDSLKWEYIFNTKDIVKELKDSEYKSVMVTLIAEFENDEKINLSNSEYLYTENKESILINLLVKENENFYNEYVYNADDIEKYLEEKWAKMTREDYKKMINWADVKITKMLKNANDSKTKLLSSIQKEEDFSSVLAKFKENYNTINLLNNLSSAVKNQAYNIKTFETIDSILK